MTHLNRLNFTYKVQLNSLTVDKCQTHSIRRFYHRLRTIKWQIGHTKVYLRVCYGKSRNIYNQLVNFNNEGEYDNQIDLFNALEAFTEQDE